MSSHFKPEGYTSVSPYLLTSDPQAVVDFLAATVDATQLRRHERPDGSIMHVEVDIDGSVVMLGGTNPDWPAETCHLHVYVPDVDATFERALANGGTEVQKPSRRPDDADRRCGVKDPAGNTWWFATQQPE